MAGDVVDQDRLAAPFLAHPVLELQTLAGGLHAKLYRLGARLQENPVPAKGATTRLEASERGKLADIEAQCPLDLAPPAPPACVRTSAAPFI
jgi:hypothetical protein